jgi:hypothetical protein
VVEFEERQRRRQARLKAEAETLAVARRRLAFGYVTAGILVAATVAGVMFVIVGGENAGQVGDVKVPAAAHVQVQSGSTNGLAFDSRTGAKPPELAQGDLSVAAATAGCDLRLDLPDEGHAHLAPDEPTPHYQTNPPTSGDHIVSPLQQADGAYAEMPEPVRFVHSLEHGRVEVQYSSQLSKRAQLALNGVFDEDPPGMLLFPNPKMPSEIAVTAWTQLMACDRYRGAATLDAIRDFRDSYRSVGPEGVVPIVLTN